MSGPGSKQPESYGPAKNKEEYNRSRDDGAEKIQKEKGPDARAVSKASSFMPEELKDRLCARIGKSMHFESLTLYVIIFNAVWIWVDVDYNKALSLFEARPEFLLMEFSFMAFFIVELGIRWTTFKDKNMAFRDPWFVFDSSLVIMMIFENLVLPLVLALLHAGKGPLGQLTALRLIRLLRLARMTRLMRAVPELMVLIRGIGSATRSVCTTLMLLTIVIYIFSLMLVQLMPETSLGQPGIPLGEPDFHTVPMAMLTLAVTGIFPDQGDLLYLMGETGWQFAMIFVLFIVIATLTVANMLVGILCEVAYRVAGDEKDRMNYDYVKAVMHTIIKNEIDLDGDHMISKKEFLSILHNEAAMAALKSVNVHFPDLVDNADFIFTKLDPDGNFVDRQLNFNEFLQVVTDLRANNFATIKDITNLRKFIKETAEKGDFVSVRGGRSGFSSRMPSRRGSSRGSPASPGLPEKRSVSYPRVAGAIENEGKDAAIGEGVVKYDKLKGMPMELEELKQRMSRLEELCGKAVHTQQAFLGMYGLQQGKKSLWSKRGGEKEFRRELQTVPMCDPITDVLDMATCMEVRMGTDRRLVSTY